LLNDVVFVECAQALGKRLAESPGDLRQRIRLAFRTALTREPTVAELSRLELLWHELHTEAQHNVKQAEGLLGSYMPERVPIPEAVAWVGLARVLLNLDEFITRE
ncbi:MAG: hypothetical protein NZM42_14185, partial [Gemmatales bacterium]|nr:hypothetical protein [Gemmatales bacterium]